MLIERKVLIIITKYFISAFSFMYEGAQSRRLAQFF